VDVRVRTATIRFDQVVLACHSDQALAMLGDASAAETEVLGAMRFQRNDTVLHTDTSLLPRNRARLGRVECAAPEARSAPSGGTPAPSATR
jgi:predicted NAD/FAD-binding protein